MREGLVDSDIADFLVALNKKPCLFTTSSCSGRVAVISAPKPMDKRNARLWYVWHDPDECLEKICNAIIEDRRDEFDYKWYSLQPPVLHIVAKELSIAEQIVECGHEAKFKRACYKRHRSGGYIVEIAAYDKLHVFSDDCNLLLGLCFQLREYKDRLEKLEKCLLERINC